MTAAIAADYPAATVAGYPLDAGGGGIEAPYAASKGGLAALTRGPHHGESNGYSSLPRSADLGVLTFLDESATRSFHYANIG